ncbi:MAG: HD domain-containing protein [Clostridiales bacterium]|nr:HD domain-containing protein [Clostridiales bacterium]
MVIASSAWLSVPDRLYADETTAAEAASGDSGAANAADADAPSAFDSLVGVSKGYSPVLYNNTNGLPTSEANAVAQTPDGFLWIGSYSGLIRYDGNTFERISSAETGITSVVALYVDSKERLWVGTNDSGAGVLEKNEWHIFNKQNGLQSLSVRAIVEDENGLIYLATTEGVAVVDENMTVSIAYAPQIKGAYVRELILGYNNVVYALTIDGAIFTLKNGGLTAYYSPQDLGVSDIHAIRPDPTHPGFLYCATKGSKIYYGSMHGKLGEPVYDIAPLSYVNSINIIEDELWVCTDNGIGRIVNGKCIKLENLPMTTSIEEMMGDYQNNLWFVSSQQGVMKIVPDRFCNLYEQYDLKNDVVYSTCMYNDRLFIGTKTSGLLVMENRKLLDSIPLEKVTTPDGQALQNTDLIALLSKAKIRSIVRDSKNVLWFSSFSDEAPLVRYDGKSAVVFTKEDGLPTNRVRTVYECKDGSYALACTGGVAILSGNKITRVYGEKDGILNDEILTLVQADNNDYLIGTDGDGIYILSSNLVTHINTDNGLSSDVVLRIKKDRTRDLYWIVTSNGISYMTPDYKVTNIKNFPYSNNFDIYQNKSDEMWILSSNGIYVADTEMMLANGEILAFYYGLKNGLSCFATSNSYSDLTEEGDLYISGSTGVVVTNIDEPNEVESDVKITVPYIEVDGERVYPDADGVFTLNPDVQKITVYAYCFNYSLVNPELTYCLEGFERNSTTLRRSEIKPIDYTNLAGGRYTFRMQLLNTKGEVQKELTITLYKRKAVTETRWFNVLALVFVAFLAALITMIFVRKKLEKLRKKSAEQKLLIREIVEAFAKVIDMKDRYTNGHSTRVAEYTAKLARELGYDEETVEKYYNIALLHDIGKVGISIETLNKPGRLTDEEFKEIKSHSGKGYVVLKDISIMPELAIGARDHHERPDGRGYPKGLTGEEIPRVAQIIAVADTFDAMYSDRPYRKRMNFDKAISIIKEVSGTQLTADVVDAFLRLVDKGEFRAEDDQGGGTFEDISNIHKAQDAAKKEEDSAAEAKGEETKPAEDEKPAPASDADASPKDEK